MSALGALGFFLGFLSYSHFENLKRALPLLQSLQYIQDFPCRNSNAGTSSPNPYKRSCPRRENRTALRRGSGHRVCSAEGPVPEPTYLTLTAHVWSQEKPAWRGKRGRVGGEVGTESGFAQEDSKSWMLRICA